MVKHWGRPTSSAGIFNWPRLAAVFLPIILAVLFGKLSSYQYNAIYGKLDKFGVDTQATILGKHSRQGKNNSSPYYEMRVRFTVDDNTRLGDVPVTLSYYQSHNKSDRVPIRYLPQDPQIRELDPAMRDRSRRRSNAIIAILVFIGLANAFMGVGSQNAKQG